MAELKAIKGIRRDSIFKDRFGRVPQKQSSHMKEVLSIMLHNKKKIFGLIFPVPDQSLDIVPGKFDAILYTFLVSCLVQQLSHSGEYLHLYI